MRRALLATVPLALAVACGDGADAPPATTAVRETPVPATGALPWPLPANPMAMAREAGVEPETAERLDYHVHAHLDVFLDGVRQPVPAGIGFDTTARGVRRYDLAGGHVGWGLEAPCATPCISPLHTHDDTGVIHTESATPQPNVLGQFFQTWGVRLDASCVGGYCRPEVPIAVYVDGVAVPGDPSSIELADRRQVAIVIGSPPAIIPATYDQTAS